MKMNEKTDGNIAACTYVVYFAVCTFVIFIFSILNERIEMVVCIHFLVCIFCMLSWPLTMEIKDFLPLFCFDRNATERDIHCFVSFLNGYGASKQTNHNHYALKIMNSERCNNFSSYIYYSPVIRWLCTGERTKEEFPLISNYQQQQNGYLFQAHFFYSFVSRCCVSRQNVSCILNMPPNENRSQRRLYFGSASHLHINYF